VVKLRTGFGLVLSVLLLLGAKCGGGEGDSGGQMIIEVRPLDERCVPIAGWYPSGFDMIPGTKGQGVVAVFSPPGLAALDLNTVPPSPLAQDVIPPLPTDSDGDGEPDGERSLAVEGCRIANVDVDDCSYVPEPVMGEVLAVSETLALVSASDYEEVIFFDVPSGELTQLWVGNAGGDHLYLPEDLELRTALSTRVCVYPRPSAVDSLGDVIDVEPLCDPSTHGYLTSFTAGKAVVEVGERRYLFVATSNVERPSQARFNPGTVLVYTIEEGGQGLVISPDPEVPVIFTEDFNPTAVSTYTAYPEAQARNLVLVTATGAIAQGTGADNVRTQGALQIIDAASRRLVARIPLGLAGPSFEGLVVVPGQRMALMGATFQRHVYAVDLTPLNDPALYGRSPGEIVTLDGTQPPFPDARLYWAASPFEIPARADGPDPRVCANLTSVAANAAQTRAFVTDFCDGTLAILDIIPEGDGSGGERLALARVENIVAPKTAVSVGELQEPGMVRVRSGTPGVDYTGPDVFFVVGQPEGQLCGVRIESFAPSP
jgi:hypothetical protein